MEAVYSSETSLNIPEDCKNSSVPTISPLSKPLLASQEGISSLEIITHLITEYGLLLGRLHKMGISRH
jgi:hypothetical protein